MLPLDTLHLGSKAWEAHSRQLDETSCVISREETLKLTHLVGARVVGYRLRDGVVDCQGSICSTPRLTLEGRWMVDLVYRRVPRIRTVSWCIIWSWDSGFHCVVWQEQGKFAFVGHTPDTWGPPRGYIQGSEMRTRWVIAGSNAKQ